MTTFVPLVGQFDNLGDVFLRRQLAAWIPDDAQVYVGPAPADFVAALDLPTAATVHRSFSRWARALAMAPPGTDYVYKPGEIQMSVPGMKEQVGLLPLVARLRRRGGTVGRAGVGVRSGGRPFEAMCRPAVSLAAVNLWRDDFSRAMFGRGTVIPDLAFAEGSEPQVWDEATRDVVIVSLRGDRPLPPDSWFRAVRGVADASGSRLVAVSQVRRDDDRTRESSAALRCEAVLMGSSSFTTVERDLRALYRRAELVVSDRLHVLVGAATEGAAVSASLVGGSAKIDRHFRVIGVPTVQESARGRAVDEQVDSFLSAVRGRSDVRRAVSAARHDLSHAREAFRSVMGFS